MGAGDRGFEEVYDTSKNEDDWSFTDLEGNPQVSTDIDETYPVHSIQYGAKTVEVYHQKYGTLWACKFKEGGELPRALKGRYTSAEDAVQAAKLYVAQQESE